MKSKNIFIIACSLLLGTGSFNCKRQIAVDAPITQLVTSSVFNDDGTATAALLGIYAQLSDFPAAVHITTGVSSDELYPYAPDQTTRDFYTNNLVITDVSLGGQPAPWQTAYQGIYQANAVLENLQQSTGVTPRVKQQLMGEAEFLRAYYYFYLVNLYGDVPLITGTDYSVNALMPRAPKEQVYQQMVKDLTAAQTDLSTDYVDATDTVRTTDRIRATVWAADALLARTYLYMGSGYYDKAEEQATQVIGNSTLFELLTDANAVFKMNSREAIWQIPNYQYQSTPQFTTEAGTFILTAPPLGAKYTVSTQLMNAFEAGDQRKLKWVGVYSYGANSWNYPAKYKDISTTASVTSEYTMMLRLSELYLIRAEARAQQGNTAQAQDDLNAVRHRAGLGDYTGATDAASLIAAISHERQVELFAEGDRWFDLKRTGTIDAVMKIVTAQKGGSWNSYQQLYPIMRSEILNDPKMVQNPGY